MKVFINSLIGLFVVSTSVQAQVQPLHTVLLVLENHSYTEIAGNPNAPYINSVLNDNHTARFTQSFALTHPSQPNYIMLYSGSSQNVSDDNLPAGLPFTSPNLGASMIQAGFSFIGYSEDLPSVGYTGEISGAYVRKHNPWVNWQGASNNEVPSASNRPFSDFPTDFSTLPTLSIVVPNLNHDIHDGTVADCDTWIQNNLANYIEWCKTNNSLFILTFDEDDHSANNQILSFFTGANVSAGTYSQRITHYNVLRTIEELYQLPYAGASADSSAIQNIWLNALPVKFLDFNAAALLNTGVLKWQTTEEHGSKEFIVEHSTNGQTWKEIAVLPAAGNSTALRKYNYTDINPVTGINFYRIKQVDLNANFIYSRTLAIQVGEVAIHYKAYPNPAANLLYIASTKNINEEVMVSVTDVSGKCVVQKKSFLMIGNPVAVDLSNFAAGTYFIRISNGTESKTETVIVK